MLKRITTSILLFVVMGLTTAVCAQNSDGISVKTVVIDAGHGGHDPGAVYGSVKEKDINLEIALGLGRRIKAGFPDVKVIYTRSKDVFVPLVERSSIANRNKADLFISIHVNSAGKANSAYGTETFIMGTDKSNSNMELCRRENSVITLEADYSTTYAGFNPDDVDSYIFFNLMQSAQFDQSIYLASMVEEKFSTSGPIQHTRGIKQAPLLVLWQTTMPSVLVEVGFISNLNDRKILTSASSRDRIAECVYNAFVDYKKHYDPSFVENAVGKKAPVAENAVAPAVQPAEKTASEIKPDDIVYRIQIFASSKKLSAGDAELKGESNFECVNVNGMYKYVVGSYKTRQDAVAELPRLKSLFEGAFIVKMDGRNNFVK